MKSRIIEDYENDIFEKYMRMNPNADPDKVAEIIRNITNQRLKNIPARLHNNIKKEWINTDMLKVFEWIENRKPIISGNGTFFMQHDEYLAPDIKMIEPLGDRRANLKKEMFKLTPGTNEYNNKNTGQGNVKVIMNADYGGGGTPLSPFFSIYLPPATTGTAKNLTTTLICCLEYLTGNPDKWAKNNNINELFDMINIVLKDTKERDLINDYSYSADDVCKWLASRTNNVSLDDYKYLNRYLKTLTPQELTKLMLAFNIHLVLRKYLSYEIRIISDYLKSNKLDINDINDDTIQKSGFGKTIPEEIKGYVDRVSKIVVDNCVYPYLINDAEVRCNYMRRQIVCVTDTDSLMVHFAHYIDSFQCRINGSFRDSCICASSLGMRLFIENIIPEYVSSWSLNVGIKDEYYRKKFVFKNEFGFLAMALVAKKMYAASMFVQEGTARNPHKIAVTGLSFKKRDAAEFLEPVMERLYDKYILTCDEVDVESLYGEYCTLRNEILNNITTNPSYFKVASYQDPSSYDPNKVLPDQIRGSLVWSSIRQDEEILPADRVKIVNLSFELLDKYAGSDENIAEILRLSLIGNEDRKHNPVICLPEHYKEIPDWVSCVIDVEYTVDKLLSPFKQLLGLFDFYLADTKGGILPSRMICL